MALWKMHRYRDKSVLVRKPLSIYYFCGLGRITYRVLNRETRIKVYLLELLWRLNKITCVERAKLRDRKCIFLCLQLPASYNPKMNTNSLITSSKVVLFHHLSSSLMFIFFLYSFVSRQVHRNTHSFQVFSFIRHTKEFTKKNQHLQKNSY